MTSDTLVERVAQAMHDAVAGDGTVEDLARIALEVSHHAELVEALTKAAPFVGWASTREQVVAGVHANELCDRIDALLATIGGDA